MKISPISGDMAVKLALGAATFGLLWYLANKVTGAAGNALTQAQALAVGAAQAVNPMNNDNMIYTGVNTMTGGTADNPLGSRIYDFFHPNA